jgi:hypothetical protein
MRAPNAVKKTVDMIAIRMTGIHHRGRAAISRKALLGELNTPVMRAISLIGGGSAGTTGGIETGGIAGGVACGADGSS